MAKRFDTPLKIVRRLKFHPNDRLVRSPVLVGASGPIVIRWNGTLRVMGHVTPWALREALRLKWIRVWTDLLPDRFYCITSRGDRAAGE